MLIDDRNLPSAVCSFCSRLESTEGRTCEAFSDGIPEEIWRGDNDHSKPVEGDGGLMFLQLGVSDDWESLVGLNTHTEKTRIS